jgi:autotransporter strand-loop-strand O-heptosyltransferase
MSKNIVLYCDKGYHELAINTIESFSRVKDNFTFHYFTIDFKPTVNIPNVVVHYISSILEVPHVQFMKPFILLEALKYVNEFIYIDCDLIPSKNFNYDDYVNSIKKYPYCPLLHKTEWQYPVYYWQHNGKTHSVNENSMMEFLNVKKRSQPWVTTLMVGVNKSCESFIKQWSDICLNKKLWNPKNSKYDTLPQKYREYFHMPDETPLNVLYWKYKLKDYYKTGAVLEPKKIESFLKLEGSLITNTRIEKDNPITDCLNSEEVYVYHQLKDLNFRKKILNKLSNLEIKKFLIVCSFYNNTKKHIEQTFKNVLNQTYNNWTLIVGNDFSDDININKFIKDKVREINDPRIIYYDIKFKRELYLYQNFFKKFDYDYYFDLDSDDIINPKILEIYNQYFEKHPEVFSIFSNYKQVNSEYKTQQYNIITPTKDYVKEFEYRNNKNTNNLWVNRSSYSMFGHARCMRRPKDDTIDILDNVRTSTDSLFLFYNLNRGKHLHIPRNLFTYVRRENSDSSQMTEEEYSNFNLNANHQIEKYKNTKPTGNLGIFDNVWYETSALSVCEFIDDFDDITLISEISEEDKKVINNLYFDKNITYNNIDGNNMVIVYNKLPKDFEWNKIKAKNVTIYNYNDDYTYSEEEMFDRFNQVNSHIVGDINRKLFGFTWFNFFRHLVITKKENINKNNIIITYNNGVKVKINGDEDKKYLLKFYNHETNTLIYESTTNTNMWSSPKKEYYIKWRVEVWSEGKILKKEILDLNNENVLIYFDSKSLGDSIAWIPYVEEFRKKHNCNVSCATFKNFLYEKSYPNINFVKVGDVTKQYKATYKIGWFFDKDKNPNDVRTIPLQQTASDILGLEKIEIRPMLDYKPKNINTGLGKYVTLSIQSTSQCKYWNKIGGWDKVVKFLNNKGIQVICVDQYSSFGLGKTMNYMPKNAINFTGKPLDEISELIYNSEFHIGISSGISWLSWGLGKKVVIVSSFSKPFCEFEEDCYRVYNDNSTSGYFNILEFKFNPSDWNWNPYKKIETIKEWDEFETIEVNDVKEKINQILG